MKNYAYRLGHLSLIFQRFLGDLRFAQQRLRSAPLGASAAARKSKVKSQKSKVLYIKAFACLKWLLYFRRRVLAIAKEQDTRQGAYRYLSSGQREKPETTDFVNPQDHKFESVRKSYFNLSVFVLYYSLLRVSEVFTNL
ncbi:MAG: hypothetical protein ACREPR_26360 [Brasilonema sp.]